MNRNDPHPAFKPTSQPLTRGEPFGRDARVESPLPPVIPQPTSAPAPEQEREPVTPDYQSRLLMLEKRVASIVTWASTRFSGDNRFNA